MRVVDRQEVSDVVNQITMNEKMDTRERGGRYWFEHCPFCETGGHIKGSDHYKHFSVDMETGRYYCYRRNKCGAQGGFYALKEQFGLNTDDYTKKIYKIPPQKARGVAEKLDKFYEWYFDTRGIKQSVLGQYGVQLSDQGNNGKFIVYNYKKKDEEGNETVFNRKYRGCTDKEKMWTEQGAEKNFYGIHTVDMGLPVITVTEGEDDAHALAQMGIENVVSIPYGAGTYTPSMHDFLLNFDQIFLCFDNDKAGDAGAKMFAEKAGLNKCLRMDLQGYKDPREALLSGETAQYAMELLDSAKQVEHESIYKLDNSITEELYDYISGAGADNSIYTPHWQFNKLLGGIRLQEMTVVTGQTGSGKSTLGYNFLHWIEQAGLPVMSFPFENKAKQVSKKVIEIRTGKATSGWCEESRRKTALFTKEQLDYELQQLKVSGWFFYRQAVDAKGYLDLDKFEKLVEYAYLFHNVQYFLIDHFHYMTKIKSASGATHELDEKVRDFRQITQRLPVHFFLVVHPAKVGQDSRGKQNAVGIDSPKGTSSLSQEADNFLVVARHGNGYSKLTLAKNREEGTEGVLYYKLSANNNLFDECFEDDPIEFQPENGGGFQ
jgi:twinkle protein